MSHPLPDPVATSPATPSPDPVPSFLVGRDAEGHWLALETHGLGAGLFRSRDDAVHYATAEAGRRPGAVRLADGLVALGPFPGAGRDAVATARG